MIGVQENTGDSEAVTAMHIGGGGGGGGREGGGGLSVEWLGF